MAGVHERQQKVKKTTSLGCCKGDQGLGRNQCAKRDAVRRQCTSTAPAAIGSIMHAKTNRGCLIKHGPHLSSFVCEEAETQICFLKKLFCKKRTSSSDLLCQPPVLRYPYQLSEVREEDFPRKKTFLSNNTKKKIITHVLIELIRDIETGR